MGSILQEEKQQVQMLRRGGEQGVRDPLQLGGSVAAHRHTPAPQLFCPPDCELEDTDGTSFLCGLGTVGAAQGMGRDGNQGHHTADPAAGAVLFWPRSQGLGILTSEAWGPSKPQDSSFLCTKLQKQQRKL